MSASQHIFGTNKHGFLIWGIALAILGTLAIIYASLATLLSVEVFGFLIFVGGVFILIDTFSFWWRKGSGFILHLLMGLLYLIVGAMIINNPLWATVSLTLLLGIFYMALGFVRIVYSLGLRMPRFGWNLFSGVIALILGVLILAQWPASSLFIIGLFVGIDLLFCGWAYIMMGLAARSLL